MTSWAFNPLTVAVVAAAVILIATAFTPVDAWERLKDWAWRSPSNDNPGRAPTMPWEQDKQERVHASSSLMSRLEEQECAAAYGESFANRWAEGRQLSAEVPETQAKQVLEGGTSLPKDAHTL